MKVSLQYRWDSRFSAVHGMGSDNLPEAADFEPLSPDADSSWDADLRVSKVPVCFVVSCFDVPLTIVRPRS